LNQEQFIDKSPNGVDSPKKSGIDINFKRVFSRALRFWYLIVLSVLVAGVIAYLVNRYSTRIYPVRASIIILENAENAGSKFLYKNELVNPARNFMNELFIMRSYPLLQGVVEELNFDVSYFKEGSIKTTEYYEAHFPIEFRILSGSKMPYGRSVNLTVLDTNTYRLELLFNDPKLGNKKFDRLNFGDTVKINGYSILLNVKSKDHLESLINNTLLVRFNDPFFLARSYASRLSATYVQTGSSVVSLEVNGSVPEKEVAFLGKFIEKYQEYDVEKKNKVATMAIKFLDHQLEVMGDSLNLLEDKIENFKNKNIITALDAETNRLYLKLQDLEDQKFQFRLRENYYKYIVTLLTSEQYDGIFTPSSVGISDAVISELITQLIDIKSKITSYQGVLRKEDNPLYREQINLIDQKKADILKTIENTRKTETINIKFINDQIGLVEAELSRLPSSEREYIDIKRNYALRENLYLFLLQKRTEAGLSKASTTSDIVVVNPPLAGGPVSPKESENYIIILALGLMLPIGGFVIAELINNKVQSKEDIEKITPVPVIGGIGHNPGDNSLIVYTKPRSSMAESFRALRSNLNYFTGNRNNLLFMITSSIPGEGKSFTTLNLACVLAMAGRKTVIVGADLRRPKLFDDLALSNDVGLSQYLSGMVTSDKIVQKTEIDNLFLIAGGPMPPNPSELLLRPAMDKLIGELRKDFDFIVVDTPPLSFVADAFMLSRHADHTIYVVRQDYTPRTAVQALDEYYSTGKLTNISILFNDLRKSGMGYGYGAGYGYGYGYNYGYGGNGLKKRKGTNHGYYSD
jgi:capsular exopolysaccharide synthesis family protein